MSVNKSEKRIEEIKSELAKIGSMRPGALTKQARGGKGEYYHLSYTYKNKGKTEYIRKTFVNIIEKEINNYKLFKSLMDEWVELSINISKQNLKNKKSEN